MDGREVVGRRLAANGLSGPPRSSPGEVVRHLLAVQSQDVHPSAWAIGQRCGASEPEVQRARAAGELLRTHVLRTTWHDVAPKDLRWLLQLTGGRVRAQITRARTEEGLTDEVLTTGRRALDGALPGRHLTRPQVGALLREHGLELGSRALGILLMQLELEGQLCSGVPAGRAQTYALLDERVGPAPDGDPEEATAELVLRFLRGHGPATVRDLAWWSSLLVRDLRAALAGLGSAVRRDDVDGLELWSATAAPPPGPPTGTQLVQAYDEHLVAFTQSKALVDPTRATSSRSGPYLAVVLQDGRVAGSWRRVPRADRVVVEALLIRPVTGLHEAAQAYGAFVGLPVELREQVG